MNVNEIESAIEHAINALALAKLALQKSSLLPAFIESDVIRKANGLTPTRSDDAITKAATAAIADLNRRLDKLEAGRDIDAQTPRKTYSVS